MDGVRESGKSNEANATPQQAGGVPNPPNRCDHKIGKRPRRPGVVDRTGGTNSSYNVYRTLPSASSTCGGSYCRISTATDSR